MNDILISRFSVRVLRIFLSGIFIVAGFNHLFNIEKIASRLANANFIEIISGMVDPKWLIISSGIVMIIAGISFLLGLKTRWAAIILIAVLIPITLTVQVGQLETMGPLFKNIAILGGLLFFILNDTTQTKK
ncbi:DoxX family protein [Marivirga sp. S37H4]|uniref:DoxX family protein n=1 Tax=Marivirga aurantiaca TaxID=2802615 RepID=A0A935C505_9BACT|nr:DoxX family protein [Marivirga aurantiaca]MBK6263545.1 DoxX family protein [Marivirga aurantiaca]